MLSLVGLAKHKTLWTPTPGVIGNSFGRDCSPLLERLDTAIAYLAGEIQRVSDTESRRRLRPASTTLLLPLDNGQNSRAFLVAAA